MAGPCIYYNVKEALRALTNGSDISVSIPALSYTLIFFLA